MRTIHRRLAAWQWPRRSVGFAILAALLVVAEAIWLYMAGVIDLSGLKDWQPLMAALVALSAGALGVVG